MSNSTTEIPVNAPKVQRDLKMLLLTQALALVAAIVLFIVVGVFKCSPWQQQADGWRTLCFFLLFSFVFVTLAGAGVACGLNFTSWRDRALASGAEFVEATMVSYMMMMLAVSGAIGRAAAPLLTDPATSHAVTNLAQAELGLGAIGFAIFKLTVVRHPKAGESKKS